MLKELQDGSLHSAMTSSMTLTEALNYGRFYILADQTYLLLNSLQDQWLQGIVDDTSILHR